MEFDADQGVRKFSPFFQKDVGQILNYKQHHLIDFIFTDSGDIIGLIKSKRAYKSKLKFKTKRQYML